MNHLIRKCLPGILFVGLVALCTSSALSQLNEIRTWTSSNGKFKTTATFDRLDGEKVILKKENGKTVTVLLSKLSKSDRKIVEKLQDSESKSTKKKSGTGRALNVPGVFSVTSPGKGLKWTVAGDRMFPNGERAVRLVCSDSRGNAVALVASLSSPSDVVLEDHARDALQGFIDALDKGIRVVDREEPARDRKKQDRYWSRVALASGNGAQQVAVLCTEFRENASYFVTAVSNDASTARELSENTINRIRETDVRDNVLAVGGSDETEKDLLLPGYFRVPSPQKGFRWQFESEYVSEVNDHRHFVFACRNPESEEWLELDVELHSRQDNKSRSRGVSQLGIQVLVWVKEGMYKNLSGGEISYGAKVPAYLTMRNTGEDSEGQPVAVQSSILFGAQTYVLHVHARDPIRADQLSDVMYLLDEYTFENPR